MNDPSIAKYASIVARCGNRFFDQALAPYSIGGGQQFFLAQIADNEGISMYDLAQRGKFDKTTVTRSIQKLVSRGYITCETDEDDRRIRHLYTTEEARPLLADLRDLRRKWEDILIQGLSEEEIQWTKSLMEKIASNSVKYLKEGESSYESK